MRLKPGELFMRMIRQQERIDSAFREFSEIAFRKTIEQLWPSKRPKKRRRKLAK